jgi:hypothetical protein
MSKSSRLFRAFARWDTVLSITAIALPLVALCGLGFFWLREQGLLLYFIAAAIALSGSLALLRIGIRWMARGRASALSAEMSESAEGVTPDPEWTADQTAAFAEAKALIQTQIRQPLPWPELQSVALNVVGLVAERSGRKTHLSFTIPEALLLIEQTTARFRADLRALVPLSDTISIHALHWIWRHQASVRRVATYGQGAWRLFRMVKNPPAAILQEVERATSVGHADYVSKEGMAILQALLMEELAKSAVDLYSGRLRFSDAELLEIQIAGSDMDRARLANPDAPVRIIVAGQVSTGKSTLINALAGLDQAETDAAPTTVRDTGYELQLGGVDCVLVDLPGLDGSAKTQAVVLSELREADLVLWTLRANRPARDIDKQMIALFDDEFINDPARRQPKIIPVATCIDMVVDGWPFPENRLSPSASAQVAAIVHAMEKDIGRPQPIPVSALSPRWNLDSLEKVLVSGLGEGLMVQRNRARLKANPSSHASEATRMARGLGTGVRRLGTEFLRRSFKP